MAIQDHNRKRLLSVVDEKVGDICDISIVVLADSALPDDSRLACLAETPKGCGRAPRDAVALSPNSHSEQNRL